MRAAPTFFLNSLILQESRNMVVSVDPPGPIGYLLAVARPKSRIAKPRVTLKGYLAVPPRQEVEVRSSGGGS